MLAGRFHPSGRNRPYPGRKIDFGPSRSEHFTGASGRDDREFERAGGRAVYVAQPGQEFRDFGEWHGRMVAAG